MLFDKFLVIVEQYAPEYRAIAEQARLFVFDVAPHEVLPEDKPDWFDPALFALPFAVTAVEDRASLIILVDSVNERGHSPLGLAVERRAIEFLYSKTSLDAFADNLAKQEVLASTQCEEESFLIQESVLEGFDMAGSQITGHFTLTKVMSIMDGRRMDMNPARLSKTEHERLWRAASQNVVAALQELVELSHPKYFVMETSTRKPRMKSKKLLRSHDRPQYTLVTAKEFRQRASLADPAHGFKRVPHERRRHLRRLSTDGGHFKTNQVLDIAAIWIGPSENVRGNRRYKVLI